MIVVKFALMLGLEMFVIGIVLGVILLAIVQVVKEAVANTRRRDAVLADAK